MARTHAWRWWEIDKAMDDPISADGFVLLESYSFDHYKDAKKAWDAITKKGTNISYFFNRMTRLQNDEVDSETLRTK